MVDNLNQSRNSTRVKQAYFPKPTQRVGHFFQHATQRYPYFLQQTASDCGAACLMMVSRYWGKQFNINYLRDLCNVNRNGTNLQGILVAAESVGFSTKMMRLSLNMLAKRQLPAIVHWQSGHYVVVYQVTRNKVIVGDPASGQCSLSHDYFRKQWTSKVLLLDPTIQFQKREEQRTSIWQFFELLKPHGKIVFQIFLTSLLIQVLSLATPILTQLLLDKVVVQGSTITLNAVGTGLLIFGIFRVIATGLQQYLLAYIANKIDLKLIVGFIHHTLRLPLSFFESRDVGEIQTRVQENSKIRNFLTGESLSIILQLLTVFVSVPLMFWYNWKLALLILAVIPAFLFLTLIATPFLRRISREIFNANAEQNNNLIDTLKGISSVKAMATEPTAQSRWEESFNRFIRRNFRGQIIGNRFSVINTGIQTLAKAGLLWFGGWLVIKGQLTIGQLVAFNMLFDRVLQPFQQLSGLWTKLQEVLISVERINDVLEAEPEEDLEQQSRQPLTKLEGQIRFEQVTFRYHSANNSNVLEDINLEIEPGQKIAIVGRSGSGKTTLSKLILGMYPPTEGRILIDDQDINFLSLRTLREHIGVVDQDSCLFRGTIRDNLSFRSPDARFEQIQEAAKQAGAHEFIQELPYGYQTNIGEGGSLLSGGQRQRLVIARALINNPSLLIFDEATSHLDAESERIIQNNFNDILRDRTAIIIAHRLSTIRNADRILVLDQGKVVESGTHKELMNKQGHYFALYQQQ